MYGGLAASVDGAEGGGPSYGDERARALPRSARVRSWPGRPRPSTLCVPDRCNDLLGDTASSIYDHYGNHMQEDSHCFENTDSERGKAQLHRQAEHHERHACSDER